MHTMKVAGSVLAIVVAASIASVGVAHAAKGAKGGAKAAKGGKTASKAAGSCGTYMYWKGGKCMDARDKVPGKA